MKCETCPNDASVHVPVIDVLLCESCRQKIDYRIQELNKANEQPTANWSCKTCGWLGLGLSIGEAPEYHRRRNSKQGKLCTGNLIKE